MIFRKESYSWDELFHAWFAGWLTGAAMVIALAVIMMGCSAKSGRVSGMQQVLPVAIVAWPSPIKPHCELPEVPSPPETIIYENPEGVALSRYYVTQRQLNEIVVWHKDIHTWAGSINDCLRKLAEDR